MEEMIKKRRYYCKQWKSVNKLLKKHSQNDMSSDDSDSDANQIKIPKLESEEMASRDLESGYFNLSVKELFGDFDPQALHDLPPSDDHREEDWVNIDIWNNNYDFSDSEDEDRNENDLCEDIKIWAFEEQIKHNALDRLLKMLKNHGHEDLPSTARTVLGTLKHVTTEKKSGMDYVYLGLKEQIISCLDRYPQTNNLHQFEISTNIDGLPLFKSSSTSSWPVLFALHLDHVQVFASAITIGNSKPSNLEFLNDTLRDLHELLENGIQYNDRKIDVSLRCIVADAPALAMIKRIKQYSGYYGCDRCTQKGEWHNKVTYQETRNLTLRTDGSFRSQEQEEHHNGVSQFCQLPMIDMVEYFSKDYMHIVCLGVMKRLMLVWMRGPRNIRISSQQKDQISESLLCLRPFIPELFARKPRGLHEFDRFKATELRQILLYTGKIAFKGVLKEDYYNHFLVLNVAMAILLCPDLLHQYADYAHSLMVYFVEKGRQLYGEEFLVYNVHSLLHLTNCAKKFRGLDNCSAFCFENYLQKLKRMVRSGNSPLVQIVKRLSEQPNIPLKLQESDKSIALRRPNNAFILGTKSCCEVIDDITNQRNKYRCRVYEDGQPLWIHPCDSSIIGVIVVRQRNSRIQIISGERLRKRAIRIEDENSDKIIFQAILHDY